MDWSWPKKWNWWARADLNFKKKKKKKREREREQKVEIAGGESIIEPSPKFSQARRKPAAPPVLFDNVK